MQKYSTNSYFAYKNIYQIDAENDIDMKKWK